MIVKFYRVSNFEEFYRKNQYVYKAAIKEVENHLPKDDFIPFMENYFGIEHEGYDFYVIPFFKTEFGMAHQLERFDGNRNITFISPFETAKLDDAGQIQYVGYESEEDILEWVVHEYAHTFFIPSLTTAENLYQLQNYEHLYQSVPDNPQIGNWFSMFAEHLAVAFEVRTAELMGENDRANKILKRHSDWPYLDHFVDQLKLYEKNRETYASITGFMPLLIDSCSSLGSNTTTSTK